MQLCHYFFCLYKFNYIIINIYIILEEGGRERERLLASKDYFVSHISNYVLVTLGGGKKTGKERVLFQKNIPIHHPNPIPST